MHQQSGGDPSGRPIWEVPGRQRPLPTAQTRATVHRVQRDQPRDPLAGERADRAPARLQNLVHRLRDRLHEVHLAGHSLDRLRAGREQPPHRVHQQDAEALLAQDHLLLTVRD